MAIHLEKNNQLWYRRF